MRFLLNVVKNDKTTEKWLDRVKDNPVGQILDKCGTAGLKALQSATPQDTGRTAASWSYEIERSSSKSTVYWKNDNVTRDGDPIAILLQYGHGTGTGGYVPARDYINPAMAPVFDAMSEEARKAVIDS